MCIKGERLLIKLEQMNSLALLMGWAVLYTKDNDSNNDNDDDTA